MELERSAIMSEKSYIRSIDSKLLYEKSIATFYVVIVMK